MWSGPRNISTAMMRSWENRPDCTVVDEPFYAAYLSATGLDHPMRAEILAAQSSEYAEVVRQISAVPVTSALQYQKQMTHHIPRGMDMSWCKTLKHCFLIRDPAAVIASYAKKMPTVTEDAIGITRQVELFEEISEICGCEPVVIDSQDVLRNPLGILRQLCEALQLHFPAEAMLKWPTGRRNSDGAWAPHWYHNVEQSTGFGEYAATSPELREEYAVLARAMDPAYRQLWQRRLLP
ncbi:hypothetical protein EY643_09090 [Halioglobus maricola]|uniref:HAD family hydrolase n=2 Tax=Halioglobus maricola TaxID=2601894 RepID=A0A5P9NPT5_9GAMM|nr:hypothetical protein EY643_09090 [Halioglobus maricola]